MQMTTRIEYAIRSMVELGADESGNPLSIKEISSRQNLPFKFLEQLFRDLKKSKLIISSRGIKGGYRLAKPSVEITLKEIITAVEENFLKINCNKHKTINGYCLGYSCGLYSVWEEIRKTLMSQLGSFTLNDVIMREKGIKDTI
ncbi:MAG: Rrf2 family transcriptional regulator [Candidatus Cloacimonetes bacterium]|nr:Rrf2 family transcriptional regulator [Candidatus Cloacimonadota bacterium]